MIPRCRFRKTTVRKVGHSEVSIVFSCRMGVQSSYVPSHCSDCSMRED